MAATLGFPDPTLQGFAPKLAKGEIASLSGAADDAQYFQVRSLRTATMQPANGRTSIVRWWTGAAMSSASCRPRCLRTATNAAVALAASGALPENVNYAVKSSFLLGFLESVPEVAAKLKPANAADEKFSEAVNSAKDATVLVLVY